MPSIQKSERNTALPIVDTEEFMKRQSREFEVGRLATAPDIKLLRGLQNLEFETAWVLQVPNWYVVRGIRGLFCIPNRYMPANSDVLMHSHPFNAKDEGNDSAMPSPGDFFNGSPIAKNYIISPVGITRFWPVEDRRGRMEIECEMSAFTPRFEERSSRAEYVQFLNDIGAKYEIHPWDAVDEQKLAELLAR